MSWKSLMLAVSALTFGIDASAKLATRNSMSMKPNIFAVILAFTTISHQALAQDAFAFFRGEAFPPPRDTPAAWLHELHKADDLLSSNIAVAEFLPNTRLAWHNHPGGQILLITDGVGYYQEKGQKKQILRVGDVVKCAPGVEHWHGAAVESEFTYVAISPAQKGGTVWAQAVTEEDYRSPAADRRSAPAIRKSGSATLTELLKADATFPFNIVSANFAPGKMLDWHKDPGGQILIITDGRGYYQERGQPKQLVRKGDIIKSAPGIEHWHGAASEIGVTHIAITPVNKAGASADKPQLTIMRAGARPIIEGPAANFTGKVTVDRQTRPDATQRIMGSLVSFEPGARTAWHTHPLGQTLIVTSGCGWVQSEGGRKEEIRAGDVIWTPANVKHWHGAQPNAAMSHYAIVEPLNGSSAEWMEKVSDQVYGPKDATSCTT